MSENRRRQATVIGVALLGAGGLMLLHNSSPVAKPKPPAPPPPAPPPPAPVPPGTSSGGVPRIPLAKVAPVAAVKAIARSTTTYTAYRLNSSGGTVKILSTSNLQAAINVSRPYGCGWVLDNHGKQVFRTACLSAPTRAVAIPLPGKGGPTVGFTA